MNLVDSVLVAIEALIANKMRAALTMLGIIIGVGAVIALMAVGQGSQKAVTDQITSLGTNLLFIRPGSSNSGGVQGGNGSAQTLSSEDGDAITANVPQALAVAPQLTVPLQLIANGTNTFTRAQGVTPDYASALNLQMASGDFISDDDITSHARVVVLGAAVAATLSPDSDPTGTNIRLGAGKNIVTAKVEGVLAAKGGTSSSSSDDQIFLPLSTVQSQISAQRGARNAAVVSQITVQVDKKGDIPAAKAAITDLLSQRHEVASPDFTIESQDDLQASINEVSQTMTVLLGSIAGISLIVGGIGIMNIMLVSVTERTREIGIRKAVGARGADILMQFLTEALTVTMLGGLIGIGMGLGSAELLNGRNIAGLGNNVQTVISWPSVFIAFGVSCAIGVFFGLYPAQRAAKLRPIEALHYE